MNSQNKITHLWTMYIHQHEVLFLCVLNELVMSLHVRHGKFIFCETILV